MTGPQVGKRRDGRVSVRYTKSGEARYEARFGSVYLGTHLTRADAELALERARAQAREQAV